MPTSLPVSLASTALLLLPLSARCVPLQHEAHVARQDGQSAITQTIMSTYFVTTTTTTFMTVSSASTGVQTATINPVVSSAASIPGTETVSIAAQTAQASGSLPSTVSTSSSELSTAPAPSPTDVTSSLAPISTSSSSISSTSSYLSSPSSTTTDSSSAIPTPTLTPDLSDPSSSNSTFVPGGDNKAKNPPPSSPPAKRLVMAYYPDWATADFPPEKIDFQRLDWIDFAFAVPDVNLNLNWDGSDDAPQMLQRLVTVAHASGKKVKLSVGGWSGSK